MILVTGATGAIARHVVDQLAAAGQRVRALVRDPATADFGDAVQVVPGSLARPDMLTAAFEGVTGAFVAVTVQPNPPTPDLRQMEANAFEAAMKAGVGHIVKLSGVPQITADFMIKTPFAAHHLGSEENLRTTGIPWTILRPAFFASNLIASFGIVPRGGLFLPVGEGKDTLIDPGDIAAVAVQVLTTPGHDGRIYELTGPDLLTYAEVVRTVSAATGKPLTFTDLTEAQWVDAMLGAGAPSDVVESIRGYFEGVHAGRITVTSTVPDLLGRPARTLEQWVAEHVEDLLGAEEAAL